MESQQRRTDYADVMNGEQERLQQIFSTGYLRPSHEEIEANLPRAKEFLQGGKLAMIIPVKEKRPVGESLLSNVTRKLPPRCITVVDGGSEARALEAARKYGIRVLSASKILDALDWERLLPILATEERPYGARGTNGKGVAVLAGYLFQYGVAHYAHFQPAWICQHDIELAEYEKYRGLEYLLYGLFQKPAARYVKMAQGGRENERCMAMRSALSCIATSPYVAPAVRKYAAELFEKLTTDKWMLTGEFMIDWATAMRRPFAIGFLEETLIALFTGSSIRVANPNPRSDDKNSQQKESKMQQEICNFLLAVALGEQRVCEWSVEDIARFNHRVLSRPIRMGWIPEPEDLGPVRAEVFEQNRIIPSVTMLEDGGFINETKLEQLVSSH
ncbi:MAG: hypothetical protein AAB533_03305 [Patescibacteria group bacterium]